MNLFIYPLICFLFADIAPDPKRPDRLWCFDDKGLYGILNGVTGKLELEGIWKPLPLEPVVDYYNCVHSLERILVCQGTDGGDYLLTGFERSSSGIGLDGIFKFKLKADLLKDNNDNDKDKYNVESVCRVRGISIHPDDRLNLFSVTLETGILIVKVSKDHWRPETILFPNNPTNNETGHLLPDTTIQWGPEEEDPITGEKGCKVVLIEEETKIMRLYTLYWT